jgi:peptidoglycan-N-acetylglucosamine deacetylase
MLRFYITTIVFSLLALIVVLLPISFGVKMYAFTVLIIASIVVLVWASANIRSGFFLKTINHNPQRISEVAITFDDGPDGVNTPQILDLLDKYNAKATFFVIGQKARENIPLLTRMVDNGHIIGNHSFGHSNVFPLKAVRTIRQEIHETNAIIEGVTNKPNRYFRPPYGVTNPNIALALRSFDLKNIGWTVRSLDTKNEKKEIVFNRIRRKLKGGDIILLHDTSKYVLEILEMLLVYLKDNGIKAVGVDELMS